MRRFTRTIVIGVLNIGLLIGLAALPLVGTLRGQDAAESLIAGKGLNERLYYAAMAGKREDVLKLLARGADPNAEIEGRLTPLLAVAEMNDPALLQELLKHGASPNLVVNGLSPLTQAVFAPNSANVELLLSAGAEPDRSDQKLTPLLASVRYGKEEACRLLLEHGASVETKPAGASLLVEAISFDRPNKKIIEMLISAGADITAADAEGVTPVASARSIGRSDIEALLLKRGAI